MATSKTIETPILIVGGGLAGLSLACLLTKHNTKCILIEKHMQSSVHPRAVGFTTRTMEIFSEIGIVDQVPQMKADFRLRRIKVESLAGKWGEELGRGAAPGGQKPQETSPAPSPYLGASIAQDKLEPMLRKRAEELGCDLRFGHRLLGFDLPSGDTEPIKVTVADPSGAEYTIHASFLVGADGHRSPVRESLSIKTAGRGHIQTLKSVLFKAPALDKYLERGFHQFQIGEQGGFGGFLTTYNDSRWVLMFQDNQQRTEEELRNSVIAAAGDPDLDFEILATGTWDVQAHIAETFVFPVKGSKTMPRVFLAGDAAHALPPTRGGYGANTGIADAHNLAWKLASVVSGASTLALLKSYDEERRPVAWVRHNQIFAGPDYAAYGRKEDDYGKFRNLLAVELGQVYESDIIVAEEENSTGQSITLNADELRGQPGSRAPWVKLEKKDGSEVSSLDQFNGQWTLVTSGKDWSSLVPTISKMTQESLTVKPFSIDDFTQDTGSQMFDALGLSQAGASLIRPDGYIAWRSREWNGGEAALQEIKSALKKIACLNS